MGLEALYLTVAPRLNDSDTDAGPEFLDRTESLGPPSHA
jgi:hypothetical protein